MAEIAAAMIDPDLHMCMCCSQTIIGLDKYIKHKQYECSALHKLQQTPQPSNTFLHVEAPSSIPKTVEDAESSVSTRVSLLSPYAKCSVLATDQSLPRLSDDTLYAGNSVVNDELTASDLENFLRSLELRSNKSGAEPKIIDGIHDLKSNIVDFINDYNHMDDKDTSSTIGIVQDYLKGRFVLNESSAYDEDPAKSMQMACLLTNLEFDSDDSDDLLGSEDLLNFSEDEDSEMKDSQGSSGNLQTCRNVSESTRAQGRKVEDTIDSKQLRSRRKDDGKGCDSAGSYSKLKTTKTVISIGKSIPGKWRPGEKPNFVARRHSSRGKWQSPEGDDVEDEDGDQTEIDDDDRSNDEGIDGTLSSRGVTEDDSKLTKKKKVPTATLR